ncbi:hypothetical protein MYAM1_001696 [Malassezia yamatoensis]|uniref:AAA+ ATPase domain-containing protein n=1 Tax=Malassezia yamatoensis TaxID=253288 RepID=A0AAJ5YWP2_9BASI|nr:hypothetical protein MYAM1_001696 [Malassezia yamatoensis]
MVADVAVFAVSQVAFFYAFKYVMSSLDPNRQKQQDTKKVSDNKLGQLGLRARGVKLNEYEEQIATELILPDDITVTFDSIGGLDSIIASLQESVIAPLCYPQLFNSASGLLGAPKGVLLYGSPGTGKTMLAKALAKESGATFINMHVSTLTNKWFGESNKLVSALFSLARKLQPSIVFIDEIDSFLRERASGDHEVMAMMKAEFMTLWDGLTSSTDRIMVLGATNRPADIDAAILRRMPKRYAVRLPDEAQRKKILSIMLADVPCHSSFNLDALARKTDGYSGSDLRELCRAAAMVPVREVLRSRSGREHVERARKTSKGDAEELQGGDLAMTVRPLRNSDFFQNDSATPLHGNTEPDTLD